MIAKSYSVLLLGGVLVTTLGRAEPQAGVQSASSKPPTAAQQAICDQNKLSSSCFALVQEMQAKTLAMTGSTPLDGQYMDVAGFLQQNFQTAYLAYIQGQVTSGAEEFAKEAAIQLCRRRRM